MPDLRVDEAINAYYRAVSTRSFEAWLALFNPEAVCHDPVGSPPAEGKEALQEVWQVLTGPFETVSIAPDDVFFAGGGAAVKWSAEGSGVNQRSVEFEGITIFDFDEDALILTAMSYWDPADVMIRLAGEDSATTRH